MAYSSLTETTHCLVICSINLDLAYIFEKYLLRGISYKIIYFFIIECGFK